MIREYKLNDIAIVIVLYGKKLADTKTFKTLLNSTIPADQLINLIIYDNSKEPSRIFLDQHYKLLSYSHDKENPGLSKAYNISAQIANNAGKRWLLIFDQDTELSQNTLNNYIKALNDNYHISLFCPILISNNLIVSPSVFKYRVGRSPKKIIPGINNLKRYSPLNSGLMIDIDLFLKVKGYNENVPLDYSDYAFIDKVKKEVKNFFVINEKLKHGLSSHESMSLTVSLFRYNSLCKGLIYSSKTNMDLFLSFIVALRRSIRLTFRYKNFIHFKILLGSFFLKKL